MSQYNLLPLPNFDRGLQQVNGLNMSDEGQLFLVALTVALFAEDTG